MSEWQLQHNGYDHRFGALVCRMKHGDKLSPACVIPIADIIRQIPAYELKCLVEIASRPKPEYTGIQVVREQVITDTDMVGKTVLDVGGYDGWAAKQCLDQGATRAIVLDNHQYEHYGWGEIKKDGVEYVRGDFIDFQQMSREGHFHAFDGKSGIDIPHPDVIIFFNVLYHLKNPWAGLDHLRTLLKPDGEMLLCTLFRYHDGAWMYLYEPRECNKDDETVYFGPSIEAIERLLRHTGWQYEQVGLQDDRVVYRCRPVKDFTSLLAAKGYARS